LEGELEKSEEKGYIGYLRGKLFNIEDEYSESAENYLTKAVKLCPNIVDAWICLGEVYWKKRDFEGSRNCFQTSIEKSEVPNKNGLRKLSMVIRQIGKSTEEKLENIKLAIDLAKQAITIDMDDGESWYILGNAQLAYFFESYGAVGLEELQKCILAYKKAERDITEGEYVIDLHHNRGVVFRYLEKYQDAIQDLTRAHEIDPSWDRPPQIIKEINEMTLKIKTNIEKNCNIKPQKLEEIIKPLTKINSIGLKDLEMGNNDTKTLHAVVISYIHNPIQIPTIMILCDINKEFFAISIYHVKKDFSKPGDVLTIQDPFIKLISIKSEKEVEYKTIVIDLPYRYLLRNGCNLSSSDFVFPYLSIKDE